MITIKSLRKKTKKLVGKKLLFVTRLMGKNRKRSMQMTNHNLMRKKTFFFNSLKRRKKVNERNITDYSVLTCDNCSNRGSEFFPKLVEAATRQYTIPSLFSGVLSLKNVNLRIPIPPYRVFKALFCEFTLNIFGFCTF